MNTTATDIPSELRVELQQPLADIAKGIRDPEKMKTSLAESESCECVTAGDKLVRKAQPQFPFVIRLASLP